jgi:hypothetical protein
MCFGLLYIVVLVLVVRHVGWRQIRVTWLIPAVWLYLTFGRARHCTLFSITAAIALAELLGQTAWAAWFVQENSGLYSPTKKEDSPHGAKAFAPYLLPIVLVLAAFGLQSTGVPLPLIGKDVVYRMKLWPTALLPQLQDYERTHPDAAIFNMDAYGGLLIYYTPRLRIFMDDRCELYGDAFLQDYFETNKALYDAAEKGQDLSRMEDPVERWQRKYHVVMDLALVVKGSGFQRYLESVPDRWQKIGDTSERGLDDAALLYQRRTSSQPPPSP